MLDELQAYEFVIRFMRIHQLSTLTSSNVEEVLSEEK